MFFSAMLISFVEQSGSAIKKNEIMPFVATWMQLEIIILSEISQKDNADIIWDHLYVDLKYHTNNFIYETERDS